MEWVAKGLEGLLYRLWQYRIARIGGRIIVIALLARFTIFAVEAYLELGTINYLLLVVSEFLTLGLVVFARDTTKVGFGGVAFFSAFAGSFYYILFNFESGIGLVSLHYAELLQVAALLFQIYAKLSLGRSFGLLPANRGVVTKGAYRLVRHPIYLGYFLGHLGFILGNFSFHNLFILVFLYFFQVLRILEEEKVLREDEAYLSYCAKTCWRFIPGIF
ncbi:methyltransferase family protein [Pseudomonas citronellolis]|uniref:methyltransferase family protein n=2 Tax=Pseudomonas citronellolis TaxID=53408 RepID=UPI0009E6E121|nr:isoprenylcysteine carboxylmethyltransferase family protein [Pseudomonas citronellolis]WBG63662.1 isoprenylcysteine carboxylmethyltransferase family protein [Pseudomonas citronellolis]